MKKIALYSLVLCGVFASGFCLAATGAQMCNKTSDGRVICNYIDRGGSAEDGLCYLTKTGNPTNPDPNIWEDFNEYWWEKKIGQDCTSGKPGAKEAKCVKNYHMANSNAFIRSCAAYECNPDWLLYTTNVRKEIPVVGTGDKVASQGLCRQKSYLSSLCDAGCGCAQDEKCVLNEVTVTNHGKNVKAFIGEELCTCEKISGGNGSEPDPDPKPHEGGNCTFSRHITVRCTNGKYLDDIYVITATEEDLKKYTCPDFQAEFDKNMALAQKYYDELCLGAGGNQGSQGPSQAEINAAKRTLEAFTASADSSANVWKDAEGNFNTARLASDLTAGVVLGTVGGVVSGVVIKKKQIEKGFDVLHCTVGGQKVADWGDTFSVGLRR